MESSAVIDTFIQQFGFKDNEEFNKLIAEIDISTQEKLSVFQNWQNNDGTKEGLSKLK